MIKQTMLALAFAAACASAFAQTAPAAPAAAGADAKKKMDPVKFAEHKQKLLDQRAKTTACITSANDPKSVMECLKSDHETMKAMHGEHRPNGKGAGIAPVPAPAAK